MSKELSEMTLEELWQLFPIFLVEPTEKWAEDYKEIESRLREILRDFTVTRISHVGSTAIKGIRAKDIVDVLIEIPRDEDMAAVARHMASPVLPKCGRTSGISLLIKDIQKRVSRTRFVTCT